MIMFSGFILFSSLMKISYPHQLIVISTSIMYFCTMTPFKASHVTHNISDG